jgi:hypothetical protein
MLTDDQLAARLTDLMREETDDVRPAPGLSATLRRRHRSQALRVRIAVAVPVAAAMAATALIATGGPGGRAAPPLANVRDVAYIGAHTQAALANADDYVIHVETRNEAGVLASVTWADLKSDRYRLDSYTGGVRDMSQVTSGLLTDRVPILTVDYHNRMWANWVWTPTPSQARELRYKCLAQTCLGGEPLDPAEISKAIAKGSLTLVGEEPVRGQTTLHLRLTGPPDFVSMDLWIDPQTYLPVRLSETVMSSTEIRDYTWLPRTPANLAVFDLRPPPGFTRTR